PVLERVKRGRAFVYRPLVTRDDVSRSVLGELRDVLFGDRLPSLMLNMISEEGLTPDEAASIRQALDQLERDT
ncbi:MAG: BlaI/MecI/CopY family transcriptional regulator, partial [Planctomycetaceae bacterium]